MLFTTSRIIIKQIHHQDAPNLCEELKFNKHILQKDGIAVLGAIWEDEVIGIVSIYNYRSGCYIISGLQVIPIFQGKGVGFMLLNEVERHCHLQQYNKMRCIIDDGMCDIGLITKLLKKQGWQELGIDHNYHRIKICDAERSFIAKHKVLYRNCQIKKFIIKTISQILPHERQSLNEYIDRIPISLRPHMIMESTIDEFNLFIVDKCRIIGWLTTTRKNNKELCIENIYVHRSFRKYQCGILLMGALMEKLQLADNITYHFISYYTNNDDKLIKRMYDLLFGKCVDKQINYYVYEKII